MRGISLNISEVKIYLAKKDEVLNSIISKIELPKNEKTNNVFHDLMSCLIEQQILFRSTKNIFKNCLQRANIEILSLENFHIFEEKGLANLKISMNKLETINRVFGFFVENEIDWHSLSDSEVIEKLSGIKGIGKWTIDMILLYTLERPNVFPYDDFHLKQIMVSLYNLNQNEKLKAQMLEVAENWGNQKSLATLYLLEWKKNSKKRFNI